MQARKSPVGQAEGGESESAASSRVPERRRCRRYRMSIPVWLSYGHNFHDTDSGRVRDFSKTGLFLVTEGARELAVGDMVKVNATFTVRSEARVVRVEDKGEGPRGLALEFLRELELDI
jgi:c-di-GMP-binding flagellar brake protein YcgR